MSSKFESTVRKIEYPQTAVYNMLSNLENIEKVRDKIPADKAENLHFDADSVSVEVAPVGKLKMKIVEREEPKCIKFQSEDSPIPFFFWIQILPMDEKTSKFKLTLRADINPFIKSMVKKPLEQGIEKIADMLQMIKYEDD